MKLDHLRDLYIEQLRDLYSAEHQLMEALPQMIKQATHPQLKQAFETHLEETRQQMKRLEQIFSSFNMSPHGETCQAMKGLIKEAQAFIGDTHHLMRSDSPDEVRDAGLIACAQRVEHYEIAGYGTVATYAEMLGRMEDHRLLGQTLSEEKMTDERLNGIALSIVNPAAARA